MSTEEVRVQELSSKTTFEKDIIGCYVSLYKVPHVCPVATNKYCKHAYKCKCLSEVDKALKV